MECSSVNGMQECDCESSVKLWPLSRHSTTQYDTTQHDTVRHNTARHSTARNSMTRRSTAQSTLQGRWGVVYTMLHPDLRPRRSPSPWDQGIKNASNMGARR